MTIAVFYKLLAIFLVVALGWLAARLRWFGEATPAEARLLGNLTFNLFIGALLFRTSVRLDFATLPWHVVVAYFVPALGLGLAVWLWQRSRRAAEAAPSTNAAEPATRAMAATFGNSVQLGIPMAAALFGEAGLAIHIALVSLHALIILSVLTVVAELDLAHAHAQQHGHLPLPQVLAATLKSVVVHPVMLPMLAGLAWNLIGIGLHPVIDEALLQLGSAAVPMCLVLIGINLRAYGLEGHVRAALTTVILKLAVLPAVVLVVAHWGFGLSGVPLAVAVMMAALPVGSNALVFAQRYETLEARVTASIVLSTLAFAGTAWIWLGVLAWTSA
jgi:predicted permease